MHFYLQGIQLSALSNLYEYREKEVKESDGVNNSVAVGSIVSTTS